MRNALLARKQMVVYVFIALSLARFCSYGNRASDGDWEEERGGWWGRRRFDILNTATARWRSRGGLSSGSYAVGTHGDHNVLDLQVLLTDCCL